MADTKFGLFVPQGWKMDLDQIDDPVEQFEAMTAVGKLADTQTQFDSIWVYDHLHTVPSPEIETTFECWTISATLARDTQRVKIGQMVGCNGYRNPALYAKIASTVDVASHGRLYAGIGAGWYEQEWRAYGYEWNDTPVRMAKFREAAEIIYKMWRDEKTSFQGKHYTIDGAINEPKGADHTPPKFWIGGGGEKVTLRLVAKYADGCNVGGGVAAMIAQKLEILKQHCENEGRDYDSIVKSTSCDPVVIVDKESDIAPTLAKVKGYAADSAFMQAPWVATTDMMIERLNACKAAGAEYFIVKMPYAAYDHEQVLRFNEVVIPAVS